MRVPQTPPDQEELLRRVLLRPERMSDLFDLVEDPLLEGQYIHWDQLRHRRPPHGLSLDEWWFTLRMKRKALAKRIPLADKSGGRFSFCLIDPLLESLQYIDSLTHGSIQMPEQVTNPETRSRYIVRSLIEESITSSQLEGASTTREVAREMIRRGRPPRDRSEQMIMNNYRTMQRISEVRDAKLTRDLVFEIHRMVTEDALDDPSGIDRFRRPDEKIYIGDEYGAVHHLPPDATELESRLAAMCDFANGGDGSYIHPAIRSMMLHFWLAYDHPFTDGNGRTARALFYWSMLKHNYWLFEFISISDVILKSHVQYGRAFLYTESDDNDLTYFLAYHSKIIHKSISKLYAYIEDKSKSVNRIQAELRGMDALNHRQRALIVHAIRHPAFIYTYESHRLSHGVVHQTARTDLLELEEYGLLHKKKAGKIWRFSPAKDIESILSRPLRKT
jgi:Fic family protein